MLHAIEYALTDLCVVDVQDRWGQTPLMYACCEGHIRIAKLLVENGAIVDLVNKVMASI